MKLKSIKKAKFLRGQKVLMRVAYDITLAKKGKSWIAPDNRRLVATLPTIKYLLKQGVGIVFLSWLKRPDGKVMDKYRMDPVAKELSRLLNKPVDKVNDCVGLAVRSRIKKLKSGDLLMLENVRFHPEEMTSNSRFAKELTQGLDLICFDAWAQIHRIHASTLGILKYLPAYSGFLLDKEINNLEKITKHPKKPLTIILGGAKISDKVNVLQSLAQQADQILIGGGLANVFLKAQGVEIGRSYLEDVFVDQAKRKKINPVKAAKNILKQHKNIVLPLDLLVAKQMNQRAKPRLINLTKGEQIEKNEMFLDIGPQTIKYYSEIIKKSRTILWNGPLGVFEISQFELGTKKIARAVASAKAITVIGGGDTEEVVKKYKLEGKFDHVSTGGGAMLDFLAGQKLPVLDKLKE